jgi:TatD DNase family protein
MNQSAIISNPQVFFDAHCHLQDERLLPDITGVLARAKAAGVAAMSCCGSSELDWLDVKLLAAAHAEIFPSFGLHPLYVSNRGKAWDTALVSLLEELPLAGVGEIGLDHALDKSTFEDQETVFMRQLAMAAEYRRPVTIHCRQAIGRLTELIKQCGGVPARGIIHSYSGPVELVNTLEDFGLCISFSGSVTFPNSKRARSAIAAVSSDKLCIETDSPDIVPFGWKTSVNEPSTIGTVAKVAAELRGVSGEEIAILTYTNASKIFLKG